MLMLADHNIPFNIINISKTKYYQSCVFLSCLLTAAFTTAAWFKTMMFVCWDVYIKWEVEVVDTLVTRMVYCES